MGYARYRDEVPGVGGPVVGFLSVLALTGVALFVTSDGFFAQPAARAVSATVYSPGISDDMSDDEVAASVGIDTTETSSVRPDEATEAQSALCDVDACAAAYRSFTAEDCTFQPFDGPRRLCRR
ncbi:MAG: BA14K family protein [Rhizobiaceae bacterium]|nr:BA14K family protein [Rhizobiaceae bacterium]